MSTAPMHPCQGCNGNGEVGGLRPDGYDSQECPFCHGSGKEALAAPTQAAGEALRQIVELCRASTTGLSGDIERIASAALASPAAPAGSDE